jgi:ABC-type phosphate transport system substrate-binding protein
VVRPAGSDAAQLFTGQALNGAAPSPSALVAPTWAAMLELVAQTPGAIGYLPDFAVGPSVKAVRLPAALRALIVAVAAAEPSGSARDFLAWAQSAPGQAIVDRRHEPIR